MLVEKVGEVYEACDKDFALKGGVSMPNLSPRLIGEIIDTVVDAKGYTWFETSDSINWIRADGINFAPIDEVDNSLNGTYIYLERAVTIKDFVKLVINGQQWSLSIPLLDAVIQAIKATGKLEDEYEMFEKRGGLKASKRE